MPHFALVPLQSFCHFADSVDSPEQLVDRHDASGFKTRSHVIRAADRYTILGVSTNSQFSVRVAVRRRGGLSLRVSHNNGVSLRSIVLVEAALICACVALSLVYLSYVVLANSGSSISHDLTSYLAPAVAMADDKMPLYSTYFDIKPPGIMLFFVPWTVVFGWRIQSMTFLEVVILCAILCSIWFILRRTCSRITSAFVYFYIISLLLSASVFSQMLLGPEFIGIATILGAVLLLGRGGHSSVFVSGFLFAFASQIKEVFAVPALFIFVFLLVCAIKPAAKRNFVAFTFGVIGGLGSIAFAVLLSGSSLGYLRSIERKRDLFPMPKAADFFPLLGSEIRDILIRHVSWDLGSLSSIAFAAAD